MVEINSPKFRTQTQPKQTDMDFTKKRKADENGTAAATAVSLTAEDSRKLLQPLTQEQLLDVLQNAVVRHSDVLDAVRLIANRDTAHRKLFVRGLGAETTSDSLRGVFAAFGELDEAIVIFDKGTGKSKGYGFVTFKNADSALVALRQPSKKIDGRITVTQFAAAGSNNSNSNSSSAAANNSSSSDVAARKIYVGNVPFDIPAERLLGHFMMYGEIEEGPLGFDRNTGKSRGFAFFVYKTEEGARAALVDPMKSIDGHQVACKLAVDNKKPKHQPDAAAAQTAPTPPPFQVGQYGPGPQQGLYYPGQGPAAAVVPGGSFGLNSSIQVPGNGGGFGPNFQGGYVHVTPAGEFSGRLQGGGAGGYPEGSHYSLGSSGQQPPVPRIPPGGMYHHYF